MKTVAIVGVGLIGGSLGRALRKTGRFRVIGISRRRSTLRNAKRLGAIDRGSLDFKDAAAAEIVVVCTPVDRIVPTIRRLLPHLRSGTWVTDVGSVKEPIVRGMAALARQSSLHFAGSHPIAGSHKTGVKASRADLFRGTTCVVTPVGKTRPAPILALWRAVGARVQVMNARRHDAALALTSHLPHFVAHSLVHVLLRGRDLRGLRPLMGGSFRDMTRVASSDPDQWVQIFQANRVQLRRGLRLFRRELARLERRLSKPALKAMLKKSQAFRTPLFNGI
jgi:prephenate dehydrogenase